jgi:hypothetical protein
MSDPHFANVPLLLHMDGSNGSTTFTDSSSNGLTVTRYGNAQISTAQSKFGGASGLFDGNGDYLTCQAGASWDIPISDNWTLECWINTSQTAIAAICARSISTFLNGSWVLVINHDGVGTASFYIKPLNAAVVFAKTTGVTINDGQWHHVAVIKIGTTYTIYVDGTARGSVTNAIGIAADASNPLTIGFQTFYNRYFSGYIDELRITKSVARYTGNFTPDTDGFYDATPGLAPPIKTNSAVIAGFVNRIRYQGL